MNPSGLWKGKCENRVGNFKFINVEILPEKSSYDDQAEDAEAKKRNQVEARTRRRRRSKGAKMGGAETAMKNRPKTVEELLKRIGLEVNCA